MSNEQRNDSPERYDVQMKMWRDGIRTAPPCPSLRAAREKELERRDMERVMERAA